MQYIQKQNWITRKKLLVLLVLVSEMGTKIVEKNKRDLSTNPSKLQWSIYNINFSTYLSKIEWLTSKSSVSPQYAVRCGTHSRDRKERPKKLEKQEICWRTIQSCNYPFTVEITVHFPATLSGSQANPLFCPLRTSCIVSPTKANQWIAEHDSKLLLSIYSRKCSTSYNKIGSRAKTLLAYNCM